MTSDTQNRSKNGQPDHSTTGLAIASCSHGRTFIGTRFQPKISLPIASRNNGPDSTAPTQNRRVISTSSGFGASVRVGSAGSSAMPQIGQAPGASRRICGCIGQVQMVPATTATGDLVGGPCR